jgi:hypothetical protein
MGAPDRGRRRLGQPKVPDPSLLDELGDGASDLLDRDLGVDQVLVVQVDDVDSQSFERALGRTLDDLRAAPTARVTQFVD